MSDNGSTNRTDLLRLDPMEDDECISSQASVNDYVAGYLGILRFNVTSSHTACDLFTLTTIFYEVMDRSIISHVFIV